MNPNQPGADRSRQTIAVFGAGMWGTVLAGLLDGKGHCIRVWDPEPGAVEHLLRERRPRALEGFRLNESVAVVKSAEEALAAGKSEDEANSAWAGVDLAVVATAAKDVERVGGIAAEALAKKHPGALWPRHGWVICAKGLHPETGDTLSDCLARGLGLKQASASALPLSESAAAPQIGVVSGPCIAVEVARGVPTSVVAAAADLNFARYIQEIFHTSRFRVYTQTDVVGVELSGSLKNVIAIAAGMCDGLGFGDNTKAALITRGLAEITRLGAAMGADPRTFAGLAGMGDLIVTSFSPHSRNRRCGEALGRGLTLDEARAQIGMAIEGIATARAACALAKKYGVMLPICEAVQAILAGKLRARDAVDALMLRDPKPEVG